MCRIALICLLAVAVAGCIPTQLYTSNNLCSMLESEAMFQHSDEDILAELESRGEDCSGFEPKPDTFDVLDAAFTIIPFL